MLQVSRSPHFLLGLIASQGRMERSAYAQSELFDQEISEAMRTIHALEAQRKNCFFDRAETLAVQQKWLTASRVAKLSASTSMIAFSYATYGKDPKAAIALLASGLTGLAAQSYQTTSKVANACLSLISGGLGAFGLYKAGQTGALQNLPEAVSSIPFGMEAMKKIIDLRNAGLHRDANHFSALLQTISSGVLETFQRLHQTCRDASQTISSLNPINEGLKDAISSMRIRS